MVSEVNEQSRSFKLIAYGERPITELFLTYATDEDIYSLIDKIRLADGNGVNIDRKAERVERIVVEAPLGKILGCADFVVFTTTLTFLFEVKPVSYEEVWYRLDYQLPRYYRFIMAKKIRSQSDLATKIHDIMRTKSRTYLICITRNHDFKNQRAMYSNVKEVNTSIVGWAPYGEIMMMLKKNGFDIMDPRSQLWAEER